MSYNGWTNNYTWLTSLHFGDDDDYIRDMCLQAWDSGEIDLNSLADMIQEYVEEFVNTDTLNPYLSDIVSHAMSDIDWHELAVAWSGDVEFSPDELLDSGAIDQDEYNEMLGIEEEEEE